MNTKGLLQKCRRRLRWLLGGGWSAADFHSRYQRSARDAWGYTDSPAHQTRLDRILAALPRPEFASVLEVGCAEGYITRSLSQRTQRLLACDLSPEAIGRAKEACRELAHAEFRMIDIRDGVPEGMYDLCVFSDVLYYMTPREIKRTLNQAARWTEPGGCMVFANEWCPTYRDLTSPEIVLRLLERDLNWSRISRDIFPTGAQSTLTIAVYIRTNRTYCDDHP